MDDLWDVLVEGRGDLDGAGSVEEADPGQDTGEGTGRAEEQHDPAGEAEDGNRGRDTLIAAREDGALGDDYGGENRAVQAEDGVVNGDLGFDGVGRGEGVNGRRIGEEDDRVEGVGAETGDVQGDEVQREAGDGAAPVVEEGLRVVAGRPEGKVEPSADRAEGLEGSYVEESYGILGWCDVWCDGGYVNGG